MRDIIEDVLRWTHQGKPVVVGTVIQTWGSAPRGVGAKIAFTPDYDVAGSVSGGCVEGAVIESGLAALETGRPVLLRYGVADETALENVGLACGGTIEVFVEPLSESLIAHWQSLCESDCAGAVAYIVEGPSHWLGGRLALVEGASEPRSLGLPTLPGEAASVLASLAQRALERGVSQRVKIDLVGEPCDIFVEVTLPRPRLIIIGAVHIAVALTAFAKTLGYHVTVVDPRSAFCTRARFPHADALVLEHPNAALASLPLTRNTAVVALTHDSKFDDPALKIALSSPAFYVGALGGARTRETRRRRLLAAGLTEAQVNRLHAPIGLDIRSRSPEEIALATIAQIVAVRNSAVPEA
ncbi:MAG: XdhC family protein [Anaerolineae bacterium]|nr:XdhC family protein [Thermoflexales bacterium]MDW8394973.1 XdhC family protein [Anaerolineae bacterium]